MSGERLLDEIFGEKWVSSTGRVYTVTWCNLCDCAIIICPKCKNGSCNGGGCEFCTEDWPEFSKFKCNPSYYLNESEKNTYFKIEALRKFIKESIVLGDYEINFDKLNRLGSFSNHTLKVFGMENLYESPDKKN